MAAIFSPLVQYPVDVSKDLLLIYNTNSLDSSNVCHYYLTHRPMVSNANVLGIGCTTNEIIEPSDYTNDILAPLQTWLAGNPTKRPQYVILFQDIPSRDDITSPNPSVQYELYTAGAATNWQPFMTAINMNGAGGTNDCIAYINKLATFASNYSPGTLIISAPLVGYGNTNWYFDDTVARSTNGGFNFGYQAEQGVRAVIRRHPFFTLIPILLSKGQTLVVTIHGESITDSFLTHTLPTCKLCFLATAAGI